MLAIYRREVRSYFTSAIGYILIAFYLLLLGIYFTAYNLNGGYTDLGGVLYYTLLIMLLFSPLLTMRLLSEERKQRTDQLLLCAPVTLWDIVGGKYLAVLTVFAVPVAVACSCPLLLAAYGSKSMLLSYAQIFAYFLIGAACIAIGLFFSGITENQIVAAATTFAVLLCCYLMDGITTLISSSAWVALLAFVLVALLIGLLVRYMTRSWRPAITVAAVAMCVLVILFIINGEWMLSALTAVLSALTLFAPFEDFAGGIFNVNAVVYYLSVILLFLFLSVQTMERRRSNV